MTYMNTTLGPVRVTRLHWEEVIPKNGRPRYVQIVRVEETKRGFVRGEELPRAEHTLSEMCDETE